MSELNKIWLRLVFKCYTDSKSPFGYENMWEGIAKGSSAENHENWMFNETSLKLDDSDRVSHTCVNRLDNHGFR